MATPLLVKKALIVKKALKSELRVVRSKPSPALPKRDELYQMGKALRDKCPRKSHANWKTPSNRPDAARDGDEPTAAS